MATVLVIDDDEPVRAAIQLILESEGHTVHSAENGKIGIDFCRAHRPDVVFVDMFMPVKDGFEVIRDIRKGPHQPWIVAMSGGGRYSVGLLDAAEDLGADRTLWKPFRREDLLQAAASRKSTRPQPFAHDGSEGRY
jgi:CheY-like chemotaxis protein